MIVGVLRLTVHVPDAASLKDKRSVVRSLKDRIEARFAVAVAEVGDLTQHRLGELGVACVTNDARHADEVLNKVADFAVANAGSGAIGNVSTEIIHLD